MTTQMFLEICTGIFLLGLTAIPVALVFNLYKEFFEFLEKKNKK